MLQRQTVRFTEDRIVEKTVVLQGTGAGTFAKIPQEPGKEWITLYGFTDAAEMSGYHIPAIPAGATIPIGKWRFVATGMANYPRKDSQGQIHLNPALYLKAGVRVEQIVEDIPKGLKILDMDEIEKFLARYPQENADIIGKDEPTQQEVDELMA